MMSDLDKKDTQTISRAQSDSEVDLEALVMALWDGKWFIVISTMLAAIMSIFVALAQPNVYTANILLAPAQSSGNAMSGLARQYGGLASLAGVSLPASDYAGRAQLGVQLMKARTFVSDFVSRRQILPELMAVESWDAATGKLSFDPLLYDSGTGEWRRPVAPPKTQIPSALEAYEAFTSGLKVVQDKKTGYVSVSFVHQSPVIASQWLTWLVEDINTAVKSQDVLEAQRSIEYLKQQIQETPLAELRAMFFELIQSQTETVMLAEVRPEYVFKTIDPAIIPEVKSGPNRAFICVLGTLIGGVLSVLGVLLRSFIRFRRDAGKRHNSRSRYRLSDE